MHDTLREQGQALIAIGEELLGMADKLEQGIYVSPQEIDSLLQDYSPDVPTQSPLVKSKDMIGHGYATEDKVDSTYCVYKDTNEEATIKMARTAALRGEVVRVTFPDDLDRPDEFYRLLVP